MRPSDEINEILTRLERIYGANMDPDEYTSGTIEDCITALISDLESYEEEHHFTNLHLRADSLMKDFAWIAAVSYYNGDSIVIFDNFPNTPQISLILLSFTKLTYSESINDSLYKQLMAYLIYIDEEHVEFRFSNSYRCIKLVIFMLLYRSFVHAAVVCRFIIQQMAASIGIR